MQNTNHNRKDYIAKIRTTLQDSGLLNRFKSNTPVLEPVRENFVPSKLFQVLLAEAAYNYSCGYN